MIAEPQENRQYFYTHRLDDGRRIVVALHVKDDVHARQKIEYLKQKMLDMDARQGCH